MVRSYRGWITAHDTLSPSEWTTRSLEEISILSQRYIAGLNAAESWNHVSGTQLQFIYLCIRLLLLDYWKDFI